MKERDVVEALKGLGWNCRKKGGDYICTKSENGILIKIFPTVRILPDCVRVALMPSLSTKDFSNFASDIFGAVVSHSHIIRRMEAPKVYVRLTLDDIAELSREVLEWASNQNIAEGIKRYCDLPTNSAGIFPLWHLTALALNRDASILARYLQEFRSGNRLGFVPYITEGMIERAMHLAREDGRSN